MLLFKIESGTVAGTQRLKRLLSTGLHPRCVPGGADAVAPSSPLSPQAGHFSPLLSGLSLT